MKSRQALVRVALLAVSVVSLLSLAMPAAASVVIGATRVVYDAREPEVTLKLSNTGESPALVQSWVDAGQLNDAPSDISVPFIVTPPLARIDPTNSQTLRIIYTGEALPGDRESVFWLNVLEAPPKPKTPADGGETHQLQLAFRSRIKLFFRPEHLPGKADDAPAQLIWQFTRANGELDIKARNPTPFHVSVAQLSVSSDGKVAIFDDGAMIGPDESHTFALHGDALDAKKAATVRYGTLNDFGGVIERSASVGALQALHVDGRD